uniref:Uncharacterized protein n=1 Tax=Aegilops tauschii subsp. strangulata TaxID=200361 RepID=A0A453JTG9_AEGTS
HTPYGAYWRMARRLCGTELFSQRRVDSYEYIRKQELRALVCGLLECRGRAVAVRQHLADATLRNVLRMSVGEKWSGCYGSAEGEEFRRTESSAVTMEWAMSELLRRPDAAAAATDELDRVVGRSRWVEESDLARLPYIDAVVKETMRLHPVGPLLVPHMAREDTLVAGYDVPAGARVLVNVWAIARDPASWPDRPDEFRPERFAGSAVDVRGQHFELLPFGAGRRICPAYGLAMKVI